MTASIAETAATEGGRRRVRLGRRALGASLLALGGCSPAGVLNALSANRLAETGISYGPEPRHRLDVYRPVGFAPSPVIVFLYGGSWQTGDRAMYRFVGAAFAARGWTVVIPDYRLYPSVRFPDFLRDCALAVAWTRSNTARLNGDGHPPWIVGHSAGAYNAAMLALAPEWLGSVGLRPPHDLRGAIGLAGPYDFLPIDDPVLRVLFGAGPRGIAPPDTQPISFADGRNPPMLLLAGAKDGTVKPGNTLRLAARIRAKGGPVQERIYPGIDHLEIIGALAPALRFLAPSFADCVSFLR
ncbi:alpha/beta hydrolase [Acetobacteraceae bacterium KSS8]|uniref:Alpha/beta hydrolase n=1 Tax=Endosaccharibacter trunci TaxID=2812733 RepID=A0ABT1WCS3_9PROT|nr:alpha/beta hydrolase [Acetobacteraceae bacterium KSS8]